MIKEHKNQYIASSHLERPH